MDETLGTSIMKSLASDSLKDLTVEFTELAIDSFLAEGIAKNLPFYQVYKLVTSFRDMALLKKTYAFLFEHRDIPLSDRVKFLSQFETENDVREFGELVIALLDRVIQIDKAKIIGKLSRAHILGKINKRTFLLLSESVDRLFLPDLDYLRQDYKSISSEESEEKQLAHERLGNAGLMSLGSQGMVFGFASLDARINALGRLFVEIVFDETF